MEKKKESVARHTRNQEYKFRALRTLTTASENTPAPHCRTWPVRLVIENAVYSFNGTWKCQRKTVKWCFFVFLQVVYFQPVWKSRSGNLKSLTGARCNPPPCDQDSSSWFPIFMNNLVWDKIWRQMPAALFLSHFLNGSNVMLICLGGSIKGVFIHTESFINYTGLDRYSNYFTYVIRPMKSNWSVCAKFKPIYKPKHLHTYSWMLAKWLSVDIHNEL